MDRYAISCRWHHRHLGRTIGPVLMRGLRHRLQKTTRRRPVFKVYLWGKYSPLLTWLRTHFSPAKITFGREKIHNPGRGIYVHSGCRWRRGEFSGVSCRGMHPGSGGAVLSITSLRLASLIEQRNIEIENCQTISMMFYL